MLEGYPYPSYQWYKNGIQLAGQTNDTVIAPVQFASYHVVVTNAFGSVTSSEAQISVRRIPTISEALDTPGWQYSGNATRQVVTGADSHDGVAAVLVTTPRGLFPGDYDGGYLGTTVTGPDLLSFWIKTSSERFEVNGAAWDCWIQQTFVSGVANGDLYFASRICATPMVGHVVVASSKGTLVLDESASRPCVGRSAHSRTTAAPGLATGRLGIVSSAGSERASTPIPVVFPLDNLRDRPVPPTPLPGATNASLVLAPVDSFGSGVLRVVATNKLVRLISDAAALKVDWRLTHEGFWGFS